MPIKITVGTNRNSGQANFGGWSASCSAEFEIDDFDGHEWAGQIQHQVQAAFSACRMAVDTELAASGQYGESESAVVQSGNAECTQPDSDGNATESRVGFPQGNGDRRPAHRPATPNQVRAIYGIATKNSVNLDQVLRCYGASNPQQLSISDASTLIDALKAAKHLGAGAVAPPPSRELASQA